VVVEIFDVCIATQKPKQFVYDGFKVQLFRRENGETFVQGKARLRAENRIGASAGAVGLEFSLVEDETEKVVILEHIRK
jgi:hypothetical protein